MTLGYPVERYIPKLCPKACWKRIVLVGCKEAMLKWFKIRWRNQIILKNQKETALLQTSFNLLNLYPSVSIDETAAVIIEILNNNIDNLWKRTKLTLTDIQKLIELSLSTNYFIFDKHVRILENSVSIGLALMVVILEAFLQHLEDKTMQKAVAANLVPLTYKRYVCDNQARFETVYQFHSFLNILKKNKALKHTMEKKNQSQKLNFFGCYNYKHWRREIWV